MRPELIDPVNDKIKLAKLQALIEQMYVLHEQGNKYSEVLKQVSKLLGRIVGEIEVIAAFGSLDHEAFSRSLLVDWNNVPADLAEAEMLEILEAFDNGKGDNVCQDYWIRCLEINTGDKQIRDLIFWPDVYFGAESPGRDLLPSEILKVALGNRKHN
jgi:hypothetical protein